MAKTLLVIVRLEKAILADGKEIRVYGQYALTSSKRWQIIGNHDSR